VFSVETSVLLFFLFWFGADFHALNLDLVVFPASHHFALREETFASRFEIFLAEGKNHLFALKLNGCHVYVAHFKFHLVFTCGLLLFTFSIKPVVSTK
jgi:hypothetical protein